MRRAFTLIELLVVIAIIAVLAALLMPALEQARIKARRIAGVANLRTMIQGFTMYANDNEDQLPRQHNHPWGYLPAYWMMDHLDVYDNRPHARAYGFMPATAHPVTGAPMVEDPPNTNAAFISSSWFYFPGYLSPPYPAETTLASAPLKLTEGGQYQMMQDHLIAYGPPTDWESNASVHAPFGGVQAQEVVSRWCEGCHALAHASGCTNPSYIYHYTRNPLGTYCGYFNGSVDWADLDDLSWAKWHGAGLWFAHHQPDVARGLPVGVPTPW